jgi:hypothetical protein
MYSNGYATTAQGVATDQGTVATPVAKNTSICAIASGSRRMPSWGVVSTVGGLA